MKTMEQRQPISPDREIAASARADSPGRPLHLNHTQVAAWTVEDRGCGQAIYRYVLRSDGKLVYRWKRSVDGRWITTPFAIESHDCQTVEEAEELFAYMGLFAIRQPARDGKPFQGLFESTTTRRPI